jgi:hypothetical protein
VEGGVGGGNGGTEGRVTGCILVVVLGLNVARDYSVCAFCLKQTECTLATCDLLLLFFARGSRLGLCCLPPEQRLLVEALLVKSAVVILIMQ